jgi:HK97 family phage portal protein
VKAVEGQYRPGPWLGTSGVIPSTWGNLWNFWQHGYNAIPYSDTSAMVEACVSAYAQTVAMCPGSHWLTNAKGGRDRQVNSALNRILRRPNEYQTISDFLLNATRRLYLTGNAFAVALRNDRFEVKELHLMLGRCQAQIAEGGEVFYQLTGNDVLERRLDGPLVVPARDVLHIRLDTPRHPLVGVSPLEAARLDVATANTISAQQVAFYNNQARPSFILSTDQILQPEQRDQLRASWDEQSARLAAGGTPIMSAGLKPLPVYSNAQDSQLAEVLKLSDQHIALVYGVPLQVLGIGGAPLGSTEALMQTWLARGLGFALNHIEEAFGILFGLKGQPEEYLEFETEALLRSALKDRMEALARGVQGGILAPNEARNREGYSSVEHGDEPRVQQQVVPLSAAAAIPAAPASPAAPPAPQPDKKGEVEGADSKRVANDNVRSFFRASHVRNLSV